MHKDCLFPRGFYAGALILFAAALAACGGGGGGGATPSVNPTSTPCPSGYTGAPPNCVAPGANTTAKGTLVGDASGSPLSGVKVQLDPWISYPTPGPTPTPIATSTTDAQGHFTISAPNGTYLLVIGNDAVNTPPPGWTTPAPSATDTPIPGANTWTATIHDRIVLYGQTTLVAPTMPPIPLYTPPATETNGSFRIATLDPLTEAPCVLAYNQERSSFGLSGAVVDEWLVENSRGFVAEHNNPAFSVQTTPAPSNPNGYLTSANAFISGGNNCLQMISGFVTGTKTAPFVANANSEWFAIAYKPFVVGSSFSAYGVAEFPIDPRVYADPIEQFWP